MNSLPSQPEDLRKRAEALLRDTHWDESAFPVEDVKTLVHELQVYQVELEMQNEELRRVQLELEKSRDRYSDLYDHAPIGYLSLNDEWIILEANLTFASLLGVSRQDLIGKRLTEYIAPRAQDTFYLHGEQVFETEARQICEVQLLKSDKSTFWVQLESIIVEEDGGGSKHCRSSVSDITERKRLQQELVDAVWQQQTLIGRELHDNLSQELTGLGLMAKSLEHKLRAKSLTEAKNAAKLVAHLVETQEGVRALASGLFPVPIDAAGLMAALEKLANVTTERYGIRCTFACDRTVLVKENTTATHLFRIAQEAVNNAAKHSQAKHIEIRLMQTAGLIHLTIHDDGVGIRDDADLTAGLGLRIMKYRASIIGARLDLKIAQERGTLVTCRVFSSRQFSNSE